MRMNDILFPVSGGFSVNIENVVNICCVWDAPWRTYLNLALNTPFSHSAILLIVGLAVINPCTVNYFYVGNHWHVKGLCGRCLSESIDWKYCQSCLPSFVNCFLSNLLYGWTLPSPLPCVKVQYIQTVCGWEGLGGIDCEVLLETIFCWSSTLYLRFRIYKIARPPHMGGGLRQITPFAKSLSR